MQVAETKERIWRKNVYAAEFDGDSWMMVRRAAGVADTTP